MSVGINEKSFISRAFKSYDNPHCVSVKEFEVDLQRFSYIKKIFTLYEQTDEINVRLLLNHIVITFNLFGNDALIFLLYKTTKDHWPYLFPFLVMLNRLPDYVQEFNLNTTDIHLDKNITNKLRNL
jgi:hypothetical protein